MASTGSMTRPFCQAAPSCQGSRPPGQRRRGWATRRPAAAGGWRHGRSAHQCRAPHRRATPRSGRRRARVGQQAQGAWGQQGVAGAAAAVFGHRPAVGARQRAMHCAGLNAKACRQRPWLRRSAALPAAGHEGPVISTCCSLVAMPLAKWAWLKSRETTTSCSRRASHRVGGEFHTGRRVGRRCASSCQDCAVRFQKLRPALLALGSAPACMPGGSVRRSCRRSSSRPPRLPCACGLRHRRPPRRLRSWPARPRPVRSQSPEPQRLLTAPRTRRQTRRQPAPAADLAHPHRCCAWPKPASGAPAAPGRPGWRGQPELAAPGGWPLHAAPDPPHR